MHPVRRYFAKRLSLLAILSAAAFALGQLGAWHWFAELFAHFLPHYAAVWLAAALLCAGRQRLLWTVFALAAACWLAQPYSAWQRQPENAGAAAQTLVWYNVNLDNPDAAAESRALLAENADALALAEIDLADGGWQHLRTAYPHGCEHREDSPFALALWFRQPPQSCTVHTVETEAGGFVYIRAEFAGTTVYALHPPPPVSGTLSAARDRYLAEAAAHIRRERKVLAVGDFNDTFSAPSLRRFDTDAGGLDNTLPHIVPTWLPFGLHIDHILGRNAAVSARPLPWRHSDHRPIAVRWR